MKKYATALLYAAAFALPLSAQAEPASLTVTTDAITPEGYIDSQYAFCITSVEKHTQNGTNRNIGLSWSKGPEATRSYAIIAVDTDVPTQFEDAGKEGKTLPDSMPRRDFYHWILLNIPASTHAIAAGQDSNGFSPNGKSDLQMPYGLRGVNDYAPFMANSPATKGVYAGYDGPCPPWNDERVHNYHFRVYALDTEKLESPEPFTGESAMKLIESHTLAQGEIVGLYTLNPLLRK